ncbi:MAG: tetratricopeptide repeat protein [Cyanobacteria bacterium REEB459]|nr:tetratricopeptide repeat protein [Cyanobacteria bacterium REEB459]
MEAVIWVVMVVTILGLGMGSMIWAYRRPLGPVALFGVAMTSSSLPLSDRARQKFEQGCEAFQQGRYAAALAAFSRTLEWEPGCSEAWHNSGRCQANLGQDGLAVEAFLEASDRYDHQGTRSGLEAVKQDLEALAQRQRHPQSGAQPTGG